MIGLMIVAFGADDVAASGGKTRKLRFQMIADMGLRTSTHSGALPPQFWTGSGANGCFSSSSTAGGIRIRE